MIKLWIKKYIYLTNKKKLIDVRLRVKKGEIVSIFGKSGEGKTTLLRIIAGLTKADYGYIKVNNERWFNSRLKINLPPQKRNIGFVFQDFALFPNMTVEENILFAMDKKDKKFLDKLLELTELKDIRKHKPNKLSGGQKQRVALARALARKPEILILDEPLSSLDFKTREKLQIELKNIHKEFNLTTILVSHNVDEIINLSDKVFIMEDGKVNGKPIKPEELKKGAKGKLVKLKKDGGKVLITLEINKDDLEKLKMEKRISIDLI